MYGTLAGEQQQQRHTKGLGAAFALFATRFPLKLSLLKMN